MTATNEWTLMFYFAGDNNLAPSMIPQLKAIKDAGFQKDTAVIIRFDPSEKGTPTRIFDVNRGARRRNGGRSMSGDGNDPFVRNLIDDVVTLKDLKTRGRARAKILDDGDTMKADESLESFLEYCLNNQSANHYMLFLIGHGLIVGNDAFLPDESPNSAITLERLGKILNKFKKHPEGKELELLCMHSCSMSAVEVAYQLKGTAKYMVASEGMAFVGSVPYRQLMKKAINAFGAQGGKLGNDGINELVKSLYFLTFFNSLDFGFAGFSADLSLCNLRRVIGLTEPLQGLVRELKAGLQTKNKREKERIKEIILLAHWKSQSYWQESYTDIYDFSRCVSERCDSKGLQKRIKKACAAVMSTIDPRRQPGAPERFNDLVVYSTCYGPTYQYSHGLSVYFPWSRPIESEAEKRAAKLRRNGNNERMDESLEGVMDRYKRYAFTRALGDDSWLSFLEMYLEETKRESRIKEDIAAKRIKKEDVATWGTNGAGGGGLQSNIDFNPLTSLDGGGHGKIDPATSKITPSDGGGGDCTCPSIKNYPQEFLICSPRRSAVNVNYDESDE